MQPLFPAEKLLDWFTNHQRKLPWREKYDPYHVWVSEVMAQQTRMDQLLPYYERFMKQFPTVKKLADADEQSVLKAWEGLGYYSRARNFQHAAQQVVREKNGKIPQTKEALLKLKGVGPYISSAIASIAYNENVCVVDGNVLRVMSRFWGDKNDVAKSKTKKAYEEKIQKILPNGKAREFNQALMELGALICVPRNPSCNDCPLQRSCHAFLHQEQEKFPVKTKKGNIPHKHFAAIRVEQNGKLLLFPRKEKLLQGMYEFPMVDYSPLSDSSSDVEKRFSEKGFLIKLGRVIGMVSHTYSHFHQHAQLFDAAPVNEIKHGWVAKQSLEKIPLSKIQQKLLKL